MSGSTDRTVRVCDLIEKTEVSMVNGHNRKISRVEASNNMKYVFSVSRINQLGYGMLKRRYKKLNYHSLRLY